MMLVADAKQRLGGMIDFQDRSLVASSLYLLATQKARMSGNVRRHFVFRESPTLTEELIHRVQRHSNLLESLAEKANLSSNASSTLLQVVHHNELKLDWKTLLDLVIELVPDFHRARLLRAHLIHATESGDSDQMHEDWRWLMSTNDRRVRARAHAQHANWLSEAESNVDLAIKVLGAAEREHPGIPSVRLNTWLFSIVNGSVGSLRAFSECISSSEERYVCSQLRSRLLFYVEDLYSKGFIGERRFGKATDQVHRFQAGWK